MRPQTVDLLRRMLEEGQVAASSAASLRARAEAARKLLWQLSVWLEGAHVDGEPDKDAVLHAAAGLAVGMAQLLDDPWEALWSFRDVEADVTD